MKRAELILLRHFLGELGDKFGAAGCNDMPQGVFSGIDEAREYILMKDFEEWDKVANPDGWELRERRNIFDFEWVAFLRSRVIREIVE
jgi:hypothetical protein